MNARQALILVPLAAIALAGCASSGSTGTAPDPAAAASAASARASQSSVAAVQSQIAKEVASQSTAASAPCTTNSCIAGDLQQNLTGLIAQDEAVSTKVKCYQRTVRYHQAADTYSATCVVTYSDGSSVTGTGNLLLSAKKVTFEPGA